MVGITDKIDLERGKYSLVLYKDGEFEVLRGGVTWVFRPPMSKMLIGILYELMSLRKIVNDIQFDFDPDEKLGPPCGPEAMKMIKEHIEQFGELES